MSAAENGLDYWIVVDGPEMMDLTDELLRGIHEYGLGSPSDLQQRIITPIVNGRDVIVQAKSDAGKVATFIIPILQRIDVATKKPQALILAQTHEDALQIQDVVMALGRYMDITCQVCVGGSSVRENVAELKKGVHFIVGTVGRINNLIQIQALTTENLKTVFLNGAGHLLCDKFGGETTKVFQCLPNHTQIILFSPKISSNFLSTANDLVRDPVQVVEKKIRPKGEKLSLEGIKQFYFKGSKAENKLELLCNLCQFITATRVIIFCKKKKVGRLKDLLYSRGITVPAVSEDVERHAREDLINKFQSGAQSILLGTYGSIRGVNVERASLVINFGISKNHKDYAGRAQFVGQKGIVINLLTNKQFTALQAIAKRYETTVEEMPFNVVDFLDSLSESSVRMKSPGFDIN